MECDQLLPCEPHPGGPHDVHPKLHPLLHLHARQVFQRDGFKGVDSFSGQWQ